MQKKYIEIWFTESPVQRTATPPENRTVGNHQKPLENHFLVAVCWPSGIANHSNHHTQNQTQVMKPPTVSPSRNFVGRSICHDCIKRQNGDSHLHELRESSSPVRCSIHLFTRACFYKRLLAICFHKQSSFKLVFHLPSLLY